MPVQAQKAQKAAGTRMRAAMLLGSKRKKSSGADSEPSDKENDQGSEATTSSGRTRNSKHMRRRGPVQQMDEVIDILRTSADKQDKFHSSLLEQHKEATASQNANHAALLSVLREGLLNQT
jgi:hypothetical protein